MHTNLIFEQAPADLPTGFVAAAQYAAGKLDSLVSGDFTNTVQVVFGDLNGSPLRPGALAESLAGTLTTLSYTDLVQQLRAHAGNDVDREMVAHLPDNVPGDLANHNFMETSTQLKALGLHDPNDTAIDGMIGFSNQYAYTFDPAHRAVEGAYDAIGLFEHELTQALGRLPYDGAFQLLAFESPGHFAQPTSATSYFSTDGGVTNRGNFSPVGDTADWQTQNPNVPDALNFITYPGVQNDITDVDIAMLGALGFGLASDIQPTGPPSLPPPNDPLGDTPPPVDPPNDNAHIGCHHGHHKMRFVDHGDEKRYHHHA